MGKLIHLGVVHRDRNAEDVVEAVPIHYGLDNWGSWFVEVRLNQHVLRWGHDLGGY